MSKATIETVLAKCKELGGTYDGRGSWDMVYFPTRKQRDAFAVWLRENGRAVMNATGGGGADGVGYTLQTR